ncbi:uncharacterized protein LOC121233060 isoform X2 [Aquila chrysaetos chrysaetos]|uniref:uncharacterized protein LOC121233060 isoform X2 n=1 Tax=Aquila chrysaetos chrysaetos TaxID=223781 RepID=UPI001B7D43CA|nr:uncharacterized protein LOC121233060 isoform X2 [Aquila chrysaetos chrysaetos]
MGGETGHKGWDTEGPMGARCCPRATPGGSGSHPSHMPPHFWGPPSAPRLLQPHAQGSPPPLPQVTLEKVLGITAQTSSGLRPSHGAAHLPRWVSTRGDPPPGPFCTPQNPAWGKTSPLPIQVCRRHPESLGEHAEIHPEHLQENPERVGLLTRREAHHHRRGGCHLFVVTYTPILSVPAPVGLSSQDYSSPAFLGFSTQFGMVLGGWEHPLGLEDVPAGHGEPVRRGKPPPRRCFPHAEQAPTGHPRVVCGGTGAGLSVARSQAWHGLRRLLPQHQVPGVGRVPPRHGGQRLGLEERFPGRIKQGVLQSDGHVLLRGQLVRHRGAPPRQVLVPGLVEGAEGEGVPFADAVPQAAGGRWKLD